MITTFFINLLGFILYVIISILPTFSVWPAELLAGLQYITQSFALLNFVFPVDQLFSALIWFIHFNALYLTAKLTLKVFNYIRGTGSGLDI